MFSWFQWTETTPAAAGTAFSTGTVTNTDPGSAAGILSSSNLDEAEMLTIVFEGPGATGGTLDVYVQTFLDAHWYDLCHIKQLANGAVATKLQYICGRANQQTGTVVAIDGTPALANDTIVGGLWGEKFRLAFVAGVGTSAGAAIKVTMAAQLMRNAKR